MDRATQRVVLRSWRSDAKSADEMHLKRIENVGTLIDPITSRCAGSRARLLQWPLPHALLPHGFEMGDVELADTS
jgi:hypothetical protein